MPDSLARLLGALHALAPSDTDPRLVADALWLAAARAAADDPSGAAETPSPGPQQVVPPRDSGSSAVERGGTATGPGVPGPAVSEAHPDGGARVAGVPLSVRRAGPLPGAVAIGRALQPLRRPWTHGTVQQLDIDATVDHFARGGTLVPLFSPAPERWFEAVLVVDASLSMAVWDETVHALAGVLEGLGAFRSVLTWQLAWEDGVPRLRDHQQRDASADKVPLAGSGAHGRRLVVVVSDCAARGWHRPDPWRIIADWGRQVPVVLVNPLPQRLWRRSALDMPAVRVTMPHAGGCNAALRFRLPARLRARAGHEDAARWQALPVAACTPHGLGAWGRALMRNDPRGCDAVLIPPAGRLPRAVARADPSGDPEALAEAFVRTAPSAAVRLAVLCSQLPEITLPMLHVLRERSVPEARMADMAELLTSGLFTVTRRAGHASIIALRPPAHTALRARLTTHDAWQTLRALDHHLAVRLGSPRGISAVLHTQGAPETLPAALQPFARASAAVLASLGIDGADAGGTPPFALAEGRAPVTEPEPESGAREARADEGDGIREEAAAERSPDSPALSATTAQRPAYEFLDFLQRAGLLMPTDFARLRRTPTLLLDARYETVPFAGRRTEMEVLGRWRDDTSEDPVSLLLVHGPGGCGKTRLAMEFARESEARGWTVRQAAAAEGGGGAEGSAQLPGAEPLLLVLDHAETTWHTQTLDHMLRDLRAQRRRARVLVLARTDASEWPRFPARSAEPPGVPTSSYKLPPLAVTSQERLAHFRRATEAFARILGLSTDGAAGIEAPVDLDDSSAYPQVATLQAAALAAVLAAVNEEVRPVDAPGASAYLQQVEWRARRWHADRTVVVAGTGEELLAGSTIRPVGTGIVIGPRLVLTASWLTRIDETRRVRVTAKRGVLTTSDWLDCHVLWTHAALGASLLRTETDLHTEPLDHAGTAAWSGRAPWAETAGAQAVPCEVFPIRGAGGTFRYPPNGTLHPERAGHRLELSDPIRHNDSWRQYVPGAPVFHGDLLVGVVAGPGTQNIPVVTMSELARDPGFADVVRRHVPPPLPFAHLSEMPRISESFALRSSVLSGSGQDERPSDTVAQATYGDVEVVAREHSGFRRGGFGSDWSDVVQLRDGRLVLIVGTAVHLPPSHGGTVGRLQDFVRDLAAGGLSPRTVIWRLLRPDPLLEGATASCLVAAYDPESAHLTLAVAGQLPVVLLDRRGRPEALRQSHADGAVGTAFKGPVEEVDVRVQPGTTLLLCSGGVAGDLVRGEADAVDGLLDRIRNATGDDRQPSLYALCDMLMTSVVANRPDADAILLGVRFPERGERQETGAPGSPTALGEPLPQEVTTASPDQGTDAPGLVEVATRWRDAPASQRLRVRNVLMDIADALEQRPSEKERLGALATAGSLAGDLTLASRLARGKALFDGAVMGVNQVSRLFTFFRKPDPAAEQEALGPLVVAASFGLALDFVLARSAARNSDRGRELARASELANALAVALSSASVLPQMEERTACRLLRDAADDFTGADLRRAELSEAQLSGIRWDDKTRWPSSRWASRIRATSRETFPGSRVHVVTTPPSGEQDEPSS